MASAMKALAFSARAKLHTQHVARTDFLRSFGERALRPPHSTLLQQLLKVATRKLRADGGQPFVQPQSVVLRLHGPLAPFTGFGGFGGLGGFGSVGVFRLGDGAQGCGVVWQGWL
jgi:hypothetical protein